MDIVVTGGCGFIGVHTVSRFVTGGHRVTVLDNMSRKGAELNWKRIAALGSCELVRDDVRDRAAVDRVVARKPDALIHLAGQVAVTTSVVDPRSDFEINALGTFNVLDAVRRVSPDTTVINASTNKVYGRLQSVAVHEEASRYVFSDRPLGIDERQPVDFHSPYGCSKGSADQYVEDFSRVYGLRTINFRQSCIYGPHQFGIEDQGWVAWFVIAHLTGRPITVFGNGKQVRDLLFVDDLVDAYLVAIARIDRVTERSLNIGGGAGNALSIVELFDMLKDISGRPVSFTFAAWRPGDQPIFIADNTAISRAFEWRPRVGVRDGVGRLYEWVRQNMALFLD